jgi:hypothetical protein
MSLPSTRPTGEQLRFASSKTGEHSLDTYLEAAERGTRTIADMLADLWDTSGGLRSDNLQFRITSAGQLQERLGDFVDPNLGWQNVTDGFLCRPRGPHANATLYERTDIVTTSAGTFICTARHTSSTANPGPNFLQILEAGTGNANGITFTPAGTIAATNVQTAIQELDSENQTAHTNLQSDINNRALSSRALTVGTGLTGGGNLTADRSFAFDVTWGDTRYRLNSGTVPWGSISGLPGTFTPSAHVHAAADITSGVFPIARLPVAASGVSSATDVVRADDTRLSNTRTPTAHTHLASEISNSSVIGRTIITAATPGDVLNAINGLSLAGGTMTGLLLVPVGSAAAPSIAFAGDPDTGMYASAADTLAWSVGGINAMRLTAAALNLPDSRIQTRVVDGQLGALFSGTTRGVRIIHNAVGTVIEGVDQTGVASFQRLSLNGSDLQFFTANAARITVDAAGLVGINIAGTPAQQLDVGGAIQITRNFAELRMLTASNVGWRLISSGTGATNGNLTIQSTSNAFTGAVSAIDVTPAGNVGIGTASPVSSLHVAKSGTVGNVNFGDDVSSVASGLNGVRILTFSDGSNYFDAKTAAGGALFFRAGAGTEPGSQRTWMTVIPTNGHVGLGIAPSFPLHVNGAVRTENRISNPQSLAVNTTVGATENAMIAGPYTVPNGITLTVDAGGNLVIV